MKTNLLKKIFSAIFYLPRQLAIIFILLYQKTLSPDHGPLRTFFPYGYCRFYPSCSAYGRLVIEKNGIFMGGVQIIWRILRCNPLNKGGVDLPK